MIFILAGNYASAKKWAIAQMLSDDEWFASLDEEDLKSRNNFHVVILDSAGELSPIFFERLFNLAHTRGRINRQ